VNPAANAANPAPESYHFRHALMGEAIYSDLLARERRRLHLTIARTLEDFPNPPARILAEHFALAGQPEKASPYALREAERARQVLAFREERHFLEIGLPSLPANSPERLATLHRLGLLSLALGDIPATLKWLTQAREGYEQAGQERQAALVLINLSFLFWFYDPARLTSQMAQLEKASQASLDAGDQTLEALSVFSHTAFSLASGDMNSPARVWVERAFDLAARLPGPATQAALPFTFLAQGLIQTDGPASESESGLAAIQQVVNLALQYNLPELVMLGYGLLFTALVNLGRYERAAALKAEICAYQDRTNSPRMTNLLAWHDFFAGNWEQAVRDLRQELARHPAPTVEALCRVALAHLLVARHELEEVPALLDAAWEKVRYLQIAYRSPALWA
jgi:tetratricopeptide (TPR) repeat protein